MPPPPPPSSPPPRPPPPPLPPPRPPPPPSSSPRPPPHSSSSSSSSSSSYTTTLRGCWACVPDHSRLLFLGRLGSSSLVFTSFGVSVDRPQNLLGFTAGDFTAFIFFTRSGR